MNFLGDRRVRFAKWQGAGNDFILVDGAAHRLPDLASWSALAPTLCDRHFGIGADGILLLDRDPEVDFTFTVVNADGSVAAMCGNGLRCAARHRAGEPDAERTLRVRTGSGIRTVAIQPDGLVRAEMGEPIVESIREFVPEAGLEVVCLSMGNPHAVAFVPDLERLDFRSLGPTVSARARTGAGVNAGFAQVLDRREIRLAVWENGVGPTLACGTGACAAVVAGILTERLTSPVTVHLPGGDLTIAWTSGEPVLMSGPAEPVYQGELDLGTFVARLQT